MAALLPDSGQIQGGPHLDTEVRQDSWAEGLGLGICLSPGSAHCCCCDVLSGRLADAPTLWEAVRGSQGPVSTCCTSGQDG